MRHLTLSEGRLFLHEPDRPPVEVESPFASEAVAREETHRERHAWKGRDREGAGPYSNQVVWGRQAAADTARHRPSIRYVARGTRPDEIFYVVAMSHSCGVFRRDLGTGEEWRLFHKQDFEACGLACDPKTGRLVVGSRGPDHVSKLQLIDEAGRRRDTITGGDGHDILPAFDAADPGWILFQSSGSARDEEGNLVAFGPAEIRRIDPEHGRDEVVLSDDGWDYLCPKRAGDGSLYFIRRPYRSRHAVPLVEHLRAVALFPVRLGMAVFGFLDVFTRLFAKQSLRPTGGPDVPNVPTRARFATFLEEPVPLDRVHRRLSKGDASVRIVPASWELVRRSPEGDEAIVDRHVVAFDLGSDGRLIYTDGVRVFLDGEGERRTEGIVQQVVCL